jgi:hypothetical protein
VQGRYRDRARTDGATQKSAGGLTPLKSGLEKRTGAVIGVPGLEPTTEAMRSSNAAATRACLPLREWPLMLIRDELIGGRSVIDEYWELVRKSIARDATNARARILRIVASG